MANREKLIAEIIAKATEELRSGEQGYHINPYDFPDHDIEDAYYEGIALVQEGVFVRGTIIEDEISIGYITHITSTGMALLEDAKSNTFWSRLWRAGQNSVVYGAEKLVFPILIAVFITIIIALISIYWGIDL